MEALSYINGRWVHGADLEHPKEVYNPSNTEELVGRWNPVDQGQAQQAVAAAAEAFPGWRDKTWVERGQWLQKMADAMAGTRSELGLLASREMGKPLGEMLGEVDRGVALLRYYAGEGTRAMGEVYPSQLPDALLFTERRPLGPVLIITPWNFPVAIPIWKMAPALVFGNTVVFKSAEWASLTAARMLQIFDQVGLPPGVLNLVMGSGSRIGPVLTQSAQIRAISFTGSQAVGSGVAQAAVTHGARFQLELGGKNPAIVLDDADVPTAVERILSGALRSAGQKCTATSRVIATPGVMAALTEALQARIKELRQAPATEQDVFLGPVVSAAQARSIEQRLEAALSQGGRVLCGPKASAHLPPGHYIAPTLVDHAPVGGVLHQEELFGPVIGLFAASDPVQAIKIANDVPYGLSASLFTRDLDLALYYMRHMEAGLVRVNEESAGVEYQAPFGGVKESSMGPREQGRAAIEFYTETRTLTVRPSC